MEKENKLTIPETQKTPITTRLLGFKVNGFSYFPNEKQKEGDSFVMDYTVKCRIGVSPSLDLVAVNVITEITPTQKYEEKIALMDTEIFFGVAGAEEYKNGNQVTFPSEFIASLINTAIGFTRGVLFSQTSVYTDYPPMIMPLVKLQDLIPKEIYIAGEPIPQT